MRCWSRTISAAICALFMAAPAAAQDFDADGYRAASYRAPVDRDPRPAARLALPAALLLQPGRDALFIDVLPAMGGVRDASTGQWRLGEEHLTIPGAVWHPEAGRSEPDPALWNALVAEVERARRTDPHVPVILFCRTDCWMGWNAARRLASQGQTNIWWLAEGIEGWRKSNELVIAEPVIVPER
ncbi:rhodanese-like domain-containing protein [Croceicoccus bisphenolivorans]|uniref:rhodanese-like domain-containing protein n=1 Tax=Croceicoccus bisphenolivorans TaxID=1783232 RepID=UPI00082ABC1E|nr:rhodanese-like domain-containing protein [Croceicoccus bisphenolivorans]